jgi:hypothetical protein
MMFFLPSFWIFGILSKQTRISPAHEHSDDNQNDYATQPSRDF